jgi:hypothetical protein
LDDLLEGLDNYGIFRRGLPSNADLQTPSIAHVLGTICSSNVATDSTFSADEHNDVLRACYRNGWVHSELIDPDGSSGVGYVLASPLHQRFVEWKLWGRHPATPSYTNLLKFSIATIRAFTPLNFSSARRIGPTGAQRPPDAQYQDEFYRCSHVISRGSTMTFSEFGTTSGRVDFYVPGKKWGVELLREGQLLAQHCSRFSKSGAYGRHLDISDYIVLDFRTTTPQLPHHRRCPVLLIISILIPQFCFRSPKPLPCRI